MDALPVYIRILALRIYEDSLSFCYTHTHTHTHTHIQTYFSIPSPGEECTALQVKGKYLSVWILSTRGLRSVCPAVYWPHQNTSYPHLNTGADLTEAFKVWWLLGFFRVYFVEFLGSFPFIQNKLSQMLIRYKYKYFKILCCHLRDSAAINQIALKY